MITVYYRTEKEIAQAEGLTGFDVAPREKIFWVDLQTSTEEELKKVQDLYEIDFNKLKAENGDHWPALR